MNLPLMLVPLILPRPPPLRSFAAHDPALKAMKCEMLAFVMSTKIVETSEVRVAVLIGTEVTAFRESAEFRGSVDRRATETMLEKIGVATAFGNSVPLAFRGFSSGCSTR
jgi:hypothetical protein